MILVVAVSGCTSPNSWTTGPANPDAANGDGGADIWTTGQDSSQGSWGGTLTNMAQSSVAPGQNNSQEDGEDGTTIR